METTVMPAAASVQKQQGLNQVVINKVQRMIESRQGGVMDTINRLLSEGRIAQDFIAPIGVSQRSKERPVISFKAACLPSCFPQSDPPYDPAVPVLCMVWLLCSESVPAIISDIHP